MSIKTDFSFIFEVFSDQTADLIDFLVAEAFFLSLKVLPGPPVPP